MIQVVGMEDYNNLSDYKSGDRVSLAEIPVIVKAVLRCKYWCIIESAQGFLHFGHDYYMYAGTIKIEDSVMTEIVDSGLFVEPMKSPYHD